MSGIATKTEPRIGTFTMTRVNQGSPIIGPSPTGWDSRFTFNATAFYLERSARNDRLIMGLLPEYALEDPLLGDGLVVVYYRGIGPDIQGLPTYRSSIGLALFTPKFRLLKRFPKPVVVPTEDPMGYDYNGTEDQRITRIGDTFYLVYCGWVTRANREWQIQVCLAESRDLINWQKLGPVMGDVNNWPNKDAVILPRRINGHYVMFHRPSVGDKAIALAISDSPTGEWRNCGTVMKPLCQPKYTRSWIGIGSTPLPLEEEGLFLADYHTGNACPSGEVDYFANYAILDFSEFDPERPEGIVKYRCEAVLTPETPYERNCPWPPREKPLNCVFPCGSYEYGGEVYMVYGGADAYVLAAKANKRELLEHIRSNGRPGNCQ